MASIGWQRASGAGGAQPAAADTTGERVGADAARPGRRIRSRRELPSRRAAVGAVLVTASALIAFAVATAGDGVPSTRYVVVTRALEPGAVLRSTDLRLVPLDLPPDQAASALQDPDALDGAVLRGPVDGGALLTDALVAPAAPGTEGAYREVSFAVPRARALLGELAPGDLVDVLASGEERTEVLVQRALVLSATDGTAEGLLVDDDVVITLALPTGAEALAVAHGAAAGELTVLRATRAGDRLPASYPTTGAAAGTAAADTAAADTAAADTAAADTAGADTAGARR